MDDRFDDSVDGVPLDNDVTLEDDVDGIPLDSANQQPAKGLIKKLSLQKNRSRVKSPILH